MGRYLGWRIISYILLLSLQPHSIAGQCKDSETDTDLTVNVNCSFVDGLLEANIEVEYNFHFAEFHISSNCTEEGVQSIFGSRQSLKRDFPLNSSGPCELHGCIVPDFQPHVRRVTLGSHVCTRPQEPTSSPGTPSVTPMPVPSTDSSSLIVEPTSIFQIGTATSYSLALSSASLSVGAAHSVEPVTGNTGASVLVVAVPIIMVVIVTVLVALLLTAIWCSCSSNKKYSTYRREAVNSVLNGSSEANTNFDNNFIFVKAVVPTSLPHSSSTMTLLDGLKFESKTPEGREVQLDCVKGSCDGLSELGYVNDGLHPMSLVSHSNNQTEKPSPRSDPHSGPMERVCSDDVFLPGNEATTTVTGDISHENLKMGFSNSNFCDHSSCSEEESSQRYFKAEDCDEDNVREHLSSDRTYVDYNKIMHGDRTVINNVGGADTPTACSLRTATKLSSSSSILEHGRISRHRVITETNDTGKNGNYDSNEVLVLLTEIPPATDDSGFKSHPDSYSMASV